MFTSADHKILMQYENSITSVTDLTGGFFTLARYNKGFAEYFVDNLKGQKEWLRMRDAFKASPALYCTMIDKYEKRFHQTNIQRKMHKEQIINDNLVKEF
ncbi:MAG: hypothetical protein FWC83_01690 [Alphaproteobacteria bacterium]|nr:hypothetical protein [Alphaproteobacteria bacterium]